MKTDCFAYYETRFGEKKCDALISPYDCEKCKFYKSKEQYSEQLKKKGEVKNNVLDRINIDSILG